MTLINGDGWLLFYQAEVSLYPIPSRSAVYNIDPLSTINYLITFQTGYIKDNGNFK